MTVKYEKITELKVEQRTQVLQNLYNKRQAMLMCPYSKGKYRSRYLKELPAIGIQRGAYSKKLVIDDKKNKIRIWVSLGSGGIRIYKYKGQDYWSLISSYTKCCSHDC